MNEKLTELEFNAYELIKEFASKRNGFFILYQIEDCYDLKNEYYHLKQLEEITFGIL